MYVLFGIAHEKVVVATLFLLISIDCTICSRPTSYSKKDVWEVYGLSLSEIAAKQIEIRLTINQSRHHCFVRILLGDCE